MAAPLLWAGIHRVVVAVEHHVRTEHVFDDRDGASERNKLLLPLFQTYPLTSGPI